MEASIMERLSVAIALAPVDLNDGANTGLRIDLRGAKKVAFVVACGDSTAAVTNFTINQHDAASSGNSKACAILNPYFYKAGVPPTAAVFTKVTATVAASNFVPTALASDPGLIVFEVNAEDLDRDNGYGWVSLSLIDATAAKLGAVIALVETDFRPAHALSR